MSGHPIPEPSTLAADEVRVPGLTVRWRLDSDRAEMALVGELDHASRPAFEQAVRDVVGSGATSLRIDLVGLDFLAVAGMHAFEEAEGRCRTAGGGLVLVNPGRAVRRLLEVYPAGIPTAGG